MPFPLSSVVVDLCLLLDILEVGGTIIIVGQDIWKSRVSLKLELNENELKLITYKSPNDLAPNYLRQLLIRNSQQSCRALRNTDRDLKLPLKKTKTNNGQLGYSFKGAKSWNGLSVVLNVHHFWHLLSLNCKYLFYISSYIHFLI